MEACVLTRHSNVCQIGDCVQSMEGLASRSSSPTDVWILFFKPQVTYYGQLLESAYLKIGISPLYIDTPANRGLLYELRVYTEVVSELLDRQICPHFVRCLMANPMCHFDDLLRVVSAGTKGVLPAGTHAEFAADILVENIAFLTVQGVPQSPRSLGATVSAGTSNRPLRRLLKKPPNPKQSPDRSPTQSPRKSHQRSPKNSPQTSPQKSPARSPKKTPKKTPRKTLKTSTAPERLGPDSGRPSITNFESRPEPPALVRDVDAVEQIERQYRYVCVMTERIDKVITLSDWLAKGTQFGVGDFMAVLFQLIVTLWVFELRKLVHYDLHTENVLLERTRPRRLGYVLNGVEYKINTTWFVRVFDFDQSYVVNLGCNQWHVEDDCQFIPNLDLARLLCDMFTDLRTSAHPRVTKMVRTLEDVFGVRQDSITPNVCYTAQASAVRKVVPNASGVPQDLLRDCLPRLSKRIEQAVGPADMFVIDERMFRPNGELRSQEEYDLLVEKKLLEHPAQDWSELTDTIYNLETGMQDLKREVERVNADVAKANSSTDSTNTWTKVGAALGLTSALFSGYTATR